MGGEGIVFINEKKLLKKDINGLIKEKISYNSAEIKNRKFEGLRFYKLWYDLINIFYKYLLYHQHPLIL